MTDITLNQMQHRCREVGAVMVQMWQEEWRPELFPEVQRSIKRAGEWMVKLRPTRRHPWNKTYPWHSSVWGYGHTPQEAFDDAIEKFLTTPQRYEQERRERKVRINPPSEPRKRITGLTLEDLL